MPPPPPPPAPRPAAPSVPNRRPFLPANPDTKQKQLPLITPQELPDELLEQQQEAEKEPEDPEAARKKRLESMLSN